MGKNKKSARDARLDNPDAFQHNIQNGGTKIFEYDGKKGCHVCGKVSSPAAPLRECSKCKEKGLKQLLYCSTNCQRVDWPEHKHFCGTDKENPSYWDDIGYSVRIPNACEDQIKLQNWTHVYRRVLIWATRQAYASKPDKKPPFNFLSITIAPGRFRRDDTGAEHDFMCPGFMTFNAAPVQNKPFFPSSAAIIQNATVDANEIGICELEYFGAGRTPTGVAFFMAPLEACGQDVHFRPYKNITQEFCPQWPWVFYTLCTQALTNSRHLDILLDRFLGHIAKVKKISERKLANFIAPALSEKRFWIKGEREWGLLFAPYELAYKREKEEEYQRKEKEYQRILDKATLDFAMDSPAKASAVVNFIRSNPDELSIRSRVAASCSPQNWQFLVDQHYPDFIIEQANRCREQALPSPQLPEWYEPAHELGRALQVTRQISEAHGTQDVRIIHRVRHAVHKLLDRILSTEPGVGVPSLVLQAEARGWADSKNEQNCVTNAAFLILAIATSLVNNPDPAMLKLFNTSGGMKIALLSWYYSGDLHTRTLSIIALDSLFRDSESAESGMRGSLHLLPAGCIAKRCVDVLRDGLLPRPKYSEIRHLELAHILRMCSETITTINGSTLGRLFVETGLHRVVFEVVKQQISRSSINWKIIDLSVLILESLLRRAPDILVTLTEYIERFCLLELLARVFMDEHFLGGPEEDPWLRTLMTVHHFVICKGGTCLWVGSGAYNELVRRMLEHGGLWRRTIRKLAKLCPEKSCNTALCNAKRKRIQGWISLCVSIGVDGSQQFVTPLTESERCHWKGCAYSHQSGDTNDFTLRKCSACQSVSYCSKDCQNKDWKAGHKQACRAIGKK